MEARPPLRNAAILVALVVIAGCATTRPISSTEPRRLVGTENDLRLDAQIFTDQLSMTQRLPMTWVITNNRAVAVGVADLLPDASYDVETQTVTIALGSEVPGQEFLPRLMVIPSGQKKSFTGVAAVRLAVPGAGNPFVRYPNAVRIKLNVLSNLQPFEKLIGLQERSVHDPALAAELFPKWLEGNEAIYTNSLPMRWAAPETDPEAAPVRRRRP